MGCRNRRNTYPSYYGRNVARNAQRKYLKEQKTKQERLNDLRVAVASICGHYFMQAIRQQFGASEEQARKVAATVDTVSLWFKEMTEINGKDLAMATLKGMIEDVQPENFWVPEVKDKNLEELNAMKDSAELTARIYCRAMQSVLGYDKETMEKVFKAAKQLYRESIAKKSEETGENGEKAEV